MDSSRRIDITFDFRSDTPDTRRRIRTFSVQRLAGITSFFGANPCRVAWSSNLMSPLPPFYLHHRSEVGEFWLSSDAVIPTFRREKRLSHIINQIPVEEQEAFIGIGYTIGGMMVFPGNRIDGKMTINGARGFHHRIKDRFDLTVECIRRHYRDERSPLSDTLARYADFFGLFGDFRGYVAFFLLQDLVTEDCSAVRFFLPFEDFNTSPLPGSMDAYLAHRQLAVDFIEARNRRILASC